MVGADSRKQAEAKLTMTGHHQNANTCFRSKYYRGSINLFNDSVPSQILESNVTETDQAAISNARWKEGRRGGRRRPSHIFIIYHLAAAFGAVDASDGENMRRVKIPPNPTNTPC